MGKECFFNSDMKYFDHFLKSMQDFAWETQYESTVY